MRFCRLATLSWGIALLLVGCQAPEAPVVAPVAPAKTSLAKPEAVPVSQDAADEAIRLQYRRVRAKELVEEARILRLKHQFGEASKRMDEANKLLEGLPEEE